jgi:hypothetical protein
MPSGVMTRPSTFFATLWLVTPLCTSLAQYLHTLSGGHHEPLAVYLLLTIEFAFWAPLVPLMVWLTRRIVAMRGGLVAAGATHAFLCTLFSCLVHFACNSIYCLATTGYGDCFSFRSERLWLCRGVAFGMFIYTATVCGVRLLDLLAAARERELRAIRAERELATAEVQIVSGQLHPEYMARVFRWVIAHLRGEPALAERMIHRLADFLRLNLHAISSYHLTLHDDVALVTSWARVESLRSGRTIEVENMIDKRWLELPIAAPVIQPLVEKASRRHVSHIRLAASPASRAVELSVSFGNEIHWVLLPAREA